METSETERLSALETKVEMIGRDVTEVKKDVKTLLLSQAASQGVSNLMNKLPAWIAIIVAGIALVKS